VVCLSEDGLPSHHGGVESNLRPSSRKSNALATRLPSHQVLVDTFLNEMTLNQIVSVLVHLDTV